MDLVSEVGVKAGQFTKNESVMIVSHFWATLLSIPVMLYGLSSIMTVWVFFVEEIWNGFPFLRTIGREDHIDEVVIEWVSLSLMIGLPFLTLLFELFRQTDNWWQTTMLSWYIGILVYFALFAVLIVYYETQASRRILHQNGRWNAQWIGGNYGGTSIWSFVLRAIESTQNQMYGGFREETLVNGHSHEFNNNNNCTRTDDGDSSGVSVPSFKFLRRWYTKITQWKIMSLFFEEVNPPEKLVNLNDVITNRQFLTKKNWSMEKGLSSGHIMKNVVVVRGNDKLKKSQIISSIVCLGLSTIGGLLLVLAFLLWFKVEFDPVLYTLISVMIGWSAYPKIVTLWRLYRVYQSQTSKKKDDGAGHNMAKNLFDDDDGIYQNTETYRISRPTLLFRVLEFLCHFGCCYLFPIANLIWLGEILCSISSQMIR